MQSLTVIAKIETDFPEKFGIPRQSGLVTELKGRVVLEPAFARKEALRGLEGFSHIWLIWGFSAASRWSFTARPPRLGGNERMGVFATRSPYRPNGLGLSAVRLERIDLSEMALYVSGVDLMNQTPIYDIKPYLPYADSYPEATGGFTERGHSGLQVMIDEKWRRLLPQEKQAALVKILEQDPRPSYQNDPEREYAFSYSGYTVRFTVKDGTAIVQQIALE